MTSKVFTDSYNRSFTVRIVNQGAKYGRNLCLTHERTQPLIEFYDVRYAFDTDENGDVLGQFVSRYNMQTVIANALNNTGINLDGNEPDWQIGPDAVVAIGKWIDEVVCCN